MSAPAGRPRWHYVLQPPSGWVWLPDPDDDIAGWAQATCAGLRGNSALGEQLRDFAVAGRQRAGELGAVWVPDPARGVLASLVTDRFPLTAPLSELAEQDRAAADPSLAPPRLDIVELPAGPALRHRRVFRGAPGPGGDALLESVSYLVAPPGCTDEAGTSVAIELVVTWSLLAAGDELAVLAADVAAGLSVGATSGRSTHA